MEQTPIDRATRLSQVQEAFTSDTGVNVENIINLLKQHANGQLTAELVKIYFKIAFDTVVKDIQEESYLISTDQPTDPERIRLLIDRGKNLRYQLQRLNDQDLIENLLKMNSENED